jgi:DNA-binding transcriptional LysR family regulator
MISRRLIRTDLNLLVALQILLEERNVTRAAERLSVSQPALSKTLQKLRESFDDELFTRTAHGLVPTPRAEVLGKELPALMESVERVLGSDDFTPETYNGNFKLLLPPILSESLLPGLMAELCEVATGVQVITGDVTPDYQEQLKKGEIDFAAFVAFDTQRDILHRSPPGRKGPGLKGISRLPPPASLSFRPGPPEQQHGRRCVGSIWRPSRYQA